MKKTLKKVILVILLMLLLLSSFQNLVLAATEISEANIVYSHDCGYHLQFWYNGRWSYVITSYVQYQAPNGQYYPAYCLNADRPGVRSRHS